MHADTENLLKIRDGEPIDAGIKASILSDPAKKRDLAKLEHVKRALRELPELTPPAEVWERVLAEAGRPAARRFTSPRRLAAAAAAAVILATHALPALLDSDRARPNDPATTSAATDRHAPAAFSPSGPDAYATLIAESARLERLLADVRYQPQLMNAGTAGTIAGLEDTIAVLDEQLTFAAAGDLDRRQREALWRERVDVMNALLQVRYAQWERPVF